MGHQIYRVTAFEIVRDYTLRIHFDDGTEQVIDFEPVLYGPVFDGAVMQLHPKQVQL